jgi:hypothetical protein
MKKTLFILFLLLTLPVSQSVANKIEIKKFQNATFPILPIEPAVAKKKPKLSKIKQPKIDSKTNSQPPFFRILNWMFSALFSKYWLPIVLMMLAMTIMGLAFQFTFPFILLVIASGILQIADIIFFFYNYHYYGDEENEQRWVGTLFWLLGFVFADLILIGFYLIARPNFLLTIGIILGVLWFVIIMISN